MAKSWHRQRDGGTEGQRDGGREQRHGQKKQKCSYLHYG